MSSTFAFYQGDDSSRAAVRHNAFMMSTVTTEFLDGSAPPAQPLLLYHNAPPRQRQAHEPTMRGTTGASRLVLCLLVEPTVVLG
jgi:hypothetical protein